MLITEKVNQFAFDTLKGLTSKNKYLLPKYFYNDRGSRIFQKIMGMPEYYLTDSELSIFETQKNELCAALTKGTKAFQLIELGAGDGLKSKILLNTFSHGKHNFIYKPVDISRHVLQQLTNDLHKSMPELRVKEYVGDFFSLIKNFASENGIPKVVLFLGSNIGNFSNDETDQFFQLLAGMMHTQDKVLLGFDLKKSPETIMNAYNDKHGFTREFNFNHLQRINHELGADFNTDNFMHHVTYDPITGETKSYLISKKRHSVSLPTFETEIEFVKWEPIFMELSKKYDIEEINSMAGKYGFFAGSHFLDDKKYFADSLWVKK
jgi:dimethylhistidine N-methyltransferase